MKQLPAAELWQQLAAICKVLLLQGGLHFAL
jgi:hypothetical protein